MQTTVHRQRFSHLSLIATALCLLTSSVQAQIQDRPKAGPEQEKLKAWIGEWTYEGTLKETPLGPGGKFAGKSTGRMILDGLFLETRGEDKGVYGGKEMVYQSVAIWWFDPGTKAYRDRHFDNDGLVGSSMTMVNGNTWTSSGTSTDSKGKNLRNRTTATFSADNNSVAIQAEISLDDGTTWMPLYELTMKKVAASGRQR